MSFVSVFKTCIEEKYVSVGGDVNCFHFILLSVSVRSNLTFLPYFYSSTSKAARKELRHFIRANQNYQFVVKTSFGSGCSTDMSNDPDRNE